MYCVRLLGEGRFGAGLFAGLLLLGLTRQLGAASITNADVTATLGPTFFVDEAAIGGTDTTINQPAVGSYERNFSGLLTSNQGPTQVIFAGFGFATSIATNENDATSLAVSITYLGADAAQGGGDDVFIGTASGNYVYAGAGEYAFAFDTPLSANLNITGIRFLVQVAPSNAAANGSVRFKVGSLAYEGTTGAKFSVAGTAGARRLNLARYQSTTASTVSGQYLATYATDGVVGNNNSWRTPNVTTPHWAEIAFPVPVTLGSAHVYSGINDGSVLTSFKVQYLSGASWLDVPASSVAGNSTTERNVLFSSPVTSDRFRLYSDENGTECVKEVALFPPNPNPANALEQGFPLGTDVELNLAKNRPVIATATDGANYPKLALDGYVNEQSKWQTSLVGSNALEIDLRVATKIGSAHLYSGATGVPPIADFVLQYWTGSAWADISGALVSGNSNAARIITFSAQPTTSMLRLVFTNSSVSAVKELCVFPANGGAGYPVGQGVTGAVPPLQNWKDYNDAFYELRNRGANLAASIVSNVPSLNTTNEADELRQYQLLLNIGTDTYRLRNRATGKCLAGSGLSANAGAFLIDQDYTSLACQNWRMVPIDGTDFYLVNEWSGLVMDSQGGQTAPGTRLVQNINGAAPSQRWRFNYLTHYPKKGSAGYLSSWSSHHSNWAYNWGRTPGAALPVQVVFNPMQWGNYNWDIGSAGGPVEQFLSEWHREDKAMHYLGFNEPDGADQSNLTVDQAVELWPRLERMGAPLISPATINPRVSWMTNFMAQAGSRGYRMDGVAVHKYPSPNGGDPSALINELQSVNDIWGRPVWFTEFSTVDWNKTGNWTAEDNYNWLAEFMWRAESLSWLRRYSLFLFTADATNPEPVSPWDPVAPRSNAFETDGVTPTAFGELYFAWDCDANVRGDKAYFLHNRGERKRIRNAAASSAPSQGSIRESTNTTQWVLRTGPAAGQWHVVSLRDGRRLRNTGSVVDFAPVGTTGTAVVWSLVEQQHGWFYLENPAAPAANRRLRLMSGTFSMVSNTTTSNQTQWRFIPPFDPVPAALPAAPVNLSALAGENQASLTWASGGTTNTTYWMYRGTNSGGRYSLIASNLPSTTYLDTAVLGGTTYFYVVTAQDAFGNESPYSNEASTTPTLPLPATPTNITFTVINSMLTLYWPSNYTGWLLQSQSNSLSTNWVTIPGSETNSRFQVPLDLAVPAVFYRLIHP